MAEFNTLRDLRVVNDATIGNPIIPTLVIKGTSITAGTTIADVSNETEAYLYKTARALGLKYVNLGLNARYVSPPTNASISFVNTRTDIPSASDFETGSYIGFECLVNDSKADPALYNTTTYEADLTLVVQAAIDKGWNPANIILLNTAYYNPSASWDVEAGHDAFTAVMQDVANDFGALYYDGYYDFKAAYLLDSSLLHTDVIHPTVAGHDYITEKLIEFFNSNSIFPSVEGNNLIVRGTINGSHTMDWDAAFNRGDFRDYGVGNIARISDYNSPIATSFQSNTSFGATNAPSPYLNSVWSFGSVVNFGGQFAVSYGNPSNGYGNPEAWIRVKASSSTWTDWKRIETAKTIKEVSGTTYTLEASDKDKILHFTDVSGCAVTVPAGLTAGNRYEGKQLGGQVTFVAGTDVVVNTIATKILATQAQYAVFGIDWLENDGTDDIYLVYGELELV